jgi:hypothetical protein
MSDDSFHPSSIAAMRVYLQEMKAHKLCVQNTNAELLGQLWPQECAAGMPLQVRVPDTRSGNCTRPSHTRPAGSADRGCTAVLLQGMHQPCCWHLRCCCL